MGFLTDFPAQELGLYFFSITVAATVDFSVSRIGPIVTLLLLVDHLGTIRDTIKS